ncbi:hypothetical protein [Paenarthrobacter nitroguajacolicus]|uniref:hypothetical protein n=1 Tax=Paenarthrobacter nitroguajacolicus TaxID=211146 RepID=UPI0015BFC09F|nr:hypothetical protein [Paenarthrobacter nitroguajacolicus]
MSEREMIDELLEDGLVDWVSLHNVVWVCTSGTINPDTKRVALDVLHRLYSEELMVPGDLGETGFEDWAPPSETWVIRSEMELDALDWHPMGDGFWLRLTPHGKVIALGHAATRDDDSA